MGGETLILTHDAMVEGVHWLPGQDMADVAWKLVAVNLSDLAAKGADPIGVLLGYALGPDDDAFAHGLKDVLTHFGVPLLGGDTVGGEGRRSFGLTALGRATTDPVPSRGGAEVGDGIWLTGAVGGAMTGFEALLAGTDADSLAYRRPRPLLAEGRALAPLVSAMMDVSDGLLLDASRMAEASRATFAIDSTAVPIDAPEGRRDDALRWGDDYALLFTLPAGREPAVAAARIGTVRSRGEAALLLDESAPEPADALGYQHR